MSRAVFVLFGDSITQQSFGPGGWGAALAHTYARKADVLLRGYSGYNTRWALCLLNEVFPLTSSKPISLVTVFFGANDCALPDRSNARQHVPISEYKSNLSQIVSHLKRLPGSPQIILITPPPIDENGRQIYARAKYGDGATSLPERTNETAGLYAEACVAVAKATGTHIIDLWSKCQKHTNWQKLLSDGLHLTSEGNMVVYIEALQILQKIGLGEADLQVDFPFSLDINDEDPKISFKCR